MTRPKAIARSAFTLVEVLVVVILLAILAAIAVPQVVNASHDAKVASVLQNLQQMRSQVQLYRAQHNDAYPDRDFVEQMTMYTNVDGEASDVRTDEFRFGPYLLSIPVNSISGDADVRTVKQERRDFKPAGIDRGWWYNTARGELRADLTDDWTDADGVPLNQR